jgi:hypothetical protein
MRAVRFEFSAITPGERLIDLTVEAKSEKAARKILKRRHGRRLRSILLTGVTMEDAR